MLDGTDTRILRELVRDGRLSITQLADKVGLSQSPCWSRVRKLEEAGYIRGYTALLDAEKLGFSETVLVQIALENQNDYQLEQVCENISRLPEVLEVHITSGSYDCFIKVAVAGTKGYETFLRDRLYKIAGIRQSHSSFSLRCFKCETAPDL